MSVRHSYRSSKRRKKRREFKQIKKRKQKTYEIIKRDRKQPKSDEYKDY